MVKDNRSNKTGRIFLIVLLVAVVGGLATATGLYFKKNRDLTKQLSEANSKLEEYKNNPASVQQAEVKGYIEAVGKLYALPQDEEPSVATVKDKEKLKDQPFFARAENGDVTLIYSTAKIAILYRPSSNQLVNVSSVTIQDEQTSAPTEP